MFARIIIFLVTAAISLTYPLQESHLRDLQSEQGNSTEPIQTEPDAELEAEPEEPEVAGLQGNLTPEEVAETEDWRVDRTES